MVPPALRADAARLWSFRGEFNAAESPTAALLPWLRAQLRDEDVSARDEPRRLVHQHVAELPGIAGVEGLGKQLAAADERRPVGVAADYRTEIRPLQVEAATEVHFIRL